MPSRSLIFFARGAGPRFLNCGCAVLLGVGLLLMASGTALAQSKTSRTRPGAESKGRPAEYTSRNFLMHTDLSAKDAKELLKKLETMIGLISEYWDRPLSGTIEIYVVKDLQNWPASSLDSRGRESIESGGGITMSSTMTRGNSFISKSVVYAVADHGTPQHETVHAYCFHSFGTAGPVWYAEGMAEMGQYWVGKETKVNCDPLVVKYLRQSEPKDLTEIVAPFEKSGDSWQNYAWRWALCHLLANNTNYSARFRPLGMQLLTKQRVSFESVYGSMAREITFEYLFFLQHFDRGYRVDLCSWDWKTRFQSLRDASLQTAKIDACAGWQPSRLKVEQNLEYEYSVPGTWQTTKGGAFLTADGESGGKGKLVGAIFHDYQLSEPFALGAYGSFSPPVDGDLFLRCQDQWNEIADNKGKVNVRLKLKGRGNALPPPKELGEDATEEPTPESKDSDPKTATTRKSSKPAKSPKANSAAKKKPKPTDADK